MLGKSLTEVHSLPAPEYKLWELFYIIEPWGWHNTDFMVAKLMAGMYTIASNGKKTFSPKDFMQQAEAEEPMPDFTGMSEQEIRDYKIAAAKRDMGI